MTRTTPGLATLACFAFASLAVATLSARAGEPGRFNMVPIDGGVMRLDTQTGAVSHCARTGGKWACVSADDDMRTMHVEIDRLISENRKLEGEVGRLRAAAPGGGEADPKRPGLSLTLPSEADIDKGLDTLDRLMRKLQERFKGMERPRGPSTPL